MQSPQSLQRSAPPAATELQWLKGCGIFVCALCCLSVLDMLAKDLVSRNSPQLVNLVRYGIILILSLALMFGKRIPFHVDPAARKWLLLRGIMLGCVGVCFMPALQWIPLGEATALYFLAPIIIVLLAPWLLGEQVRRQQYIAVALGLVGMLLIVNPGGDLPFVGSMLMLIAAFCYAMVQLLTRKLTGRVISEQQFFYTAAICAPIGLFVLCFYWPQVWPNTHDMVELLLMGLCGGLGQYLLIYAFKSVPASILAPINYFQLVLAVLFSQLIFGHTPSVLSYAGIVLIGVAGLSLTLPMLTAYLRRNKP